MQPRVRWLLPECASSVDQGTPEPLRRALVGHDVATAYERGWSRLKNGDLLDAAEKAGIAVLVTTDSGLKYQQNMGSHQMAVVVLSATSWPRIQHAVAAIASAVDRASAGSHFEVDIP